MSNESEKLFLTLITNPQRIADFFEKNKLFVAFDDKGPQIISKKVVDTLLQAKHSEQQVKDTQLFHEYLLLEKDIDIDELYIEYEKNKEDVE